MTGLKELFLLDRQVTYLNHGSFGATPAAVFNEYQRWQQELEHQPTEFLGRRFEGLMHEARSALGSYLGAAADDVVFMENITFAVNAVARSLNLGSGDEVLTTDHEYGACDRIWRFLAERRGFSYIVRSIRIPLASSEEVVEDFMRGVSGRTRVIFLSHITGPTAIRFPVDSICRRARQAGILTVVDGAHAPGQIPLNLMELGADFYGGNLHKWLCAPKGAGFLFARPERQPLLEPLIVSWGYEPEKPSGSAFIDQNQWWGTRDVSAFLSVPAAIEFQREHYWDRVQDQCHDLLVETLERLRQLTGIRGYYPDDSWYVQMGAAPLPLSVDAEALKTNLYDRHRVEVPVVVWNGLKLLRISIQAYNDQADVDRLLFALKATL